jgi:hypothetical protein
MIRAVGVRADGCGSGGRRTTEKCSARDAGREGNGFCAETPGRIAYYRLNRGAVDVRIADVTRIAKTT